MATRVAGSRVQRLPYPKPIAANSLLFSTFDTPPLTPEANDDEAIISTAVSVLREQRSKSRWRFLRALYGSTGLSPSQAAEIIRRLRNTPHLALRFFLWSLRRGLCPHDLRSRATTAHVLARGRLRPAALSLLKSAIRSHESRCDFGSLDVFEALVKTYRACDSAPFVFDLLITGYLDAKKLDRAIEIARLLRSRGIHPLVATSNLLIRSVSRARGSDAGLELYRELFKQEDTPKTRARVSPNVHTFNVLLLAFHRDGGLDRAEAIRAEMERLSCHPNAFTFSVLMAGLCDKGKIGKAKSLWDEMARKGIRPDIVAFNILIGGYCEASEVGKAEELYREMALSGIEPSCATFQYLIKGHCWVGDLDSALLVYEDMKRRGFGPDAETVDEMLDEMCEKGRAKEGLVILRKEMRREEFCVNRRSYEVLIRGSCEEGEMEKAMNLQAEMAGKGFEAGFKVYGAFIKGYAEQGDVEKAERLRNEMVQMVLEEED